ncbi:MAG: hypothetical protein RI985_658, partial [Chloroflexota bacterium]
WGATTTAKIMGELLDGTSDCLHGGVLWP